MKRYIGVCDNEEKKIVFYTYDEGLLKISASMSTISQDSIDYNGEMHSFYIIHNNGMIPVTYPLISQFPGVEKVEPNIEDLFHDVAEHARKLEYLKKVDTKECRVNLALNKTHKNLVGDLSLEIMFNDKIIDMFEKEQLKGYFRSIERTRETDELINTCLKDIPVNKIANWLLTDPCSALIESYQQYKEYISLDDLYRNIKSAATIVYDPSFDGTVDSYISIQEKYQELNMI